jgi:hypothetical protein
MQHVIRAATKNDLIATLVGVLAYFLVCLIQVFI